MTMVQRKVDATFEQGKTIAPVVGLSALICAVCWFSRTLRMHPDTALRQRGFPAENARFGPAGKGIHKTALSTVKEILRDVLDA